MTLEDALRHFGNKAEIARALNITPAAVYQWGDKLPELRAFQLSQKIEEMRAAEGADSSGVSQVA